MISTLKKKLNKKGFTLAELLIVVAIIAILVAIAIPVFSTQLEGSREAVDRANARSANSMAVADYLVNNKTGSAIYYFKEDNGNIEIDATITNQTKSIMGKSGDCDDVGLKVTVSNGEVTENSWITALS